MEMAATTISAQQTLGRQDKKGCKLHTDDFLFDNVVQLIFYCYLA